MEPPVLTAWMIAGFAAFVVWLSVRSMNREKAARDRARSIKARVREAHGVGEMFVSFEDGSFVGLDADGRRLALGGADGERVVPVAAMVCVEGLRDGTALVRADRSGRGPLPAPVDNPADVPERIRSLALRITLEDGDHTVLFFDGGKHGAVPVNESFRKAAARTEDWFRKLSHAMRPAG
jgi:hypothetical protein